MFEIVVTSSFVVQETRSVEQTGYHSKWSHMKVIPKDQPTDLYEDEILCKEIVKKMNEDFIKQAQDSKYKNEFRFAFCRNTKLKP